MKYLNDEMIKYLNDKLWNIGILECWNDEDTKSEEQNSEPQSKL